MARGQRKRILAPAQADLRLWYIRTHARTHTHFSPVTHPPLISFCLFECCLYFLPLFSYFSHLLCDGCLLMLHCFQVLCSLACAPRLVSSRKVTISSSFPICVTLATCLLHVSNTHTRAHERTPTTVLLCVSDCVDLSRCQAALQFAVCLTGSY